jgi:hypothetical protein
MRWHPKAEDYLWRPDLQQAKLSESGQWNLRYKVQDKRRYLERFQEILGEMMPYCGVRYAF